MRFNLSGVFILSEGSTQRNVNKVAYMKFAPEFEKAFFGRMADMNAPIDDRPMDEWGCANVTMGSWSPWPGKLSFEQAPQLVEPLRCLSRATCHRITIVAAAAGGKSTVGEVFVSHCIAVDPGFLCWFSHTKDMAKEFAETRIWPFLENCPPVVALLPSNRNKKRNTSIMFPHMSFLILPANKSAAQSKHIRFAIFDEPWLYEPGMLAQLHKRTTKFAHNRKILELSTGSILGDETDEAYQAGTKREWQFTCPKCGKMWIPPFTPEKGLSTPGGVRWDPKAKMESGVWDFNRVRATTYYECPFCLERYAPTEENAYKLNRPDSYTPGTPDAAHESFHYPAWVSDFRLLPDYAVEFIQSKAAIRRGSIELLQEFTQKREATAWDGGRIDAEPATEVQGDYTMGDPWPDARARLGAVDVQKHWMWLLARDWALGPKTRLVAYEKILTWDQLRRRQLELGIDDALMFVDSSHFTELVYGQCCRFGWNAIKGEKAPNGFEKKVSDTLTLRVSVIESNDKGRPAQLPADARYTACQLWRVSEELTAQRLYLFRTGRALGWSEPRNAPTEYTEQVAAKVRRARRHPRTGQTIWEWVTIGKCGEHAYDCNRYQIAGAELGGGLDEIPIEPIDTDTQKGTTK